MKVLVCIPCLLNGGTEVQTLSLVEALVAAGHRVTVACYFEHIPTMVSRFEAAGADVRLLSAEGARPIGLKATVAHLWRGLRRVVRDVRPDAAHVQYMNPGALAVLLVRLAGVKKILATTHTAADIYSRNGLRIINLLTRRVLTAFQCITLLAEKSYFGTGELFNGTIPRSKHFTIYNALPSHISIRTSPRRPCADGYVTIGVVSRLEGIKGMDLVVPAFIRVKRSFPNVKLLVVGDGSQRELMQRQAVESGFCSDVEFVGAKPQQELEQWYDRIDILLMPSRSEGFGLTAIEGMARGCVPVVAATGGLPEVVTSDCGLLHRLDDADDLSEKIMQIMSDLDMFQQLSAGAIDRAEVFSAKKFSDNIMQLYYFI